jgi:hypothetical protein
MVLAQPDTGAAADGVVPVCCVVVAPLGGVEGGVVDAEVGAAVALVVPLAAVEWGEPLQPAATNAASIRATTTTLRREVTRLCWHKPSTPTWDPWPLPFAG